MVDALRRKPVYWSASTGSNTHLRVVSDAAYKKETDDGYSLRGALYCRGTGTARESFVGQKTPVHIVDWVSTSQRHVTRSTFSAELLAAEDAVDQGILISHVLCELEYGPMDARAARDRRMEGGYIPTALYVDATSVFAVVTATFVQKKHQLRSLYLLMSSIFGNYLTKEFFNRFSGLTPVI